MPIVASFHLTRYPWRHALAAMAGLPTRQRALVATPGVRFARQLGTGRGSAMGLGADLRRWATFAVWDDESALDTFLASSPLAARWQDQGDETWNVRLAPLSAHGSWGGARPLAETEARPEPGAAHLDTGDRGPSDIIPDRPDPASPPDEPRPDAAGRLPVAHDPDDDGPVAVLTRARIGLRHWPAFYRSVPAVEDHLRRQSGLMAVVGIGEAPLGLQATFSLWRSTASMEAFAYRGSAHEEVVRRTRAEGWFAEELFARFRPYASSGAWDGADPLALTRR